MWAIYAMQFGTVNKTIVRHVPEAKFAVACSGDDLKIANDFSAAYLGYKNVENTPKQVVRKTDTSRTSGCFRLVSLAKDCTR